MDAAEIKSFYFRTFARVAIIPYVGGTIAHTLRLIYEFPLVEAPHWIHWGIVLIGGYACFGFIYFVRKIPFTGLLDKVFYGLVIFHLGGSVLLHGYSLIVRNSNWMGIFSMQFSYAALVYFVALGFYCRSLSKRIGSL